MAANTEKKSGTQDEIHSNLYDLRYLKIICFYKIDQMWTDKTYIAVLKRQASLQFAVLITILDDVVS